MPAAYRHWGETEHQELCYRAVNLRQPVAVHIPSALGKLGYFVCLRVPNAWAARLGLLTLHAEIAGLRPDRVSQNAGQGLGEERQFASSPGFTWVLHSRLAVSRGDGTLVFGQVPADLPPVDLLLCTWTRYLASGMADAWLTGQADPAWAPTGIPLGGIGTGKVELCRDGRLRHFTGNNNQDMPFEEPDGLPGAGALLAVDGKRLVMATRPLGEYQPVPTLHFTGTFPQAKLRAPDLVPGLSVSLLATGSLQPGEPRGSSLPGVLWRFRAHNEGHQPKLLRFGLSWPNLIGHGGGLGKPESRLGYGDGFYAYWEEKTGQFTTPLHASDLHGWRYGAANATPEHLASQGEHLLVWRREPGVATELTWDGTTPTVWAEIELAGGEIRDTYAALVWAMPHWVDSQGTERGQQWQNHWPDALAMARELLAQPAAWLAATGALSTHLHGGTLPAWLARRLGNCTYPLVSNSVWYRDGRFSINEGPTEMAGCYGTIDQRLGAHPATQLLFPGLNALELGLFGARQSPNGGINHDLGAGHLESTPKDQPWPDIPCSYIIQGARHAWSTGDAAFAAEFWPRAVKALERHAQWAEAGGGIAQVGHGLGTSYDGYHYEGATPYVATLWLAALAIMDRHARDTGNRILGERIAIWRTAALAMLEAHLWTGSAYRCSADPARGQQRDTCHAGQLAGQHFARLLTGQDILPADRLQPAVDSLLRLNGNPRFSAPPDETSFAGDCVVEYGWLPYVEAFMLTAAASLGHPELPALWERLTAVFEDGGRRPCETRLMYRPLTGEPSWGSWYMTAPSAWLVYEAWLDFSYEPGTGTLRLAPRQDGTWPLVHPCFWGRAEARAGQLTLHIDRVFGTTPLPLLAWESRATSTTRTWTQHALPASTTLHAGLRLKLG